MRLIDAMAYRQVLEEEKNFTLDEDVNMGLEIAIADLVDAPTIEAEPVRHGRWVNNHCTECGEMPMGTEAWERLDIEPPRFELFMDFCPCCGAKMDGDNNEP